MFYGYFGLMIKIFLLFTIWCKKQCPFFHGRSFYTTTPSLPMPSFYSKVLRFDVLLHITIIWNSMCWLSRELQPNFKSFMDEFSCNSFFILPLRSRTKIKRLLLENIFSGKTIYLLLCAKSCHLMVKFAANNIYLIHSVFVFRRWGLRALEISLSR